jgi:nucleotide-binding universal stress UspA family protein
MLYRLLLGSVTAKVLHSSECPVWSNAPTDESTASDFAIRRILCAVDLTPHSCHTIARAAELAAEFGASLTLVHITSGANTFGPGGDTVDVVWQESLVRFATEEIAKLQQQAGTDAEVLIDCGDVHELLKRAAQQRQADLLVIGHMPPGGHLGQNGSGYSLIRDSHVPVLSL